MPDPSFAQRFGLVGKPIVDDFPQEAKVALAYVLDDMICRGFLPSTSSVLREIGRLSGTIEANAQDGSLVDIAKALEPLVWFKVYDLCESANKRIVAQGSWERTTDGDFDWVVAEGGAERARAHFGIAINQLLVEQNLGYEFHNGHFERRGRPQTQKSLQRASTILSQARFEPVRTHYNKARKFFEQLPEPDVENTVKEAVCALEVCAKVVSGHPKDDLPKILSRLEGNGSTQIPPTICAAVTRVYDYRGNAQGVAHGRTDGSKVGPFEAEFVLSVAASCITYLADKFPEAEEEIPF